MSDEKWTGRKYRYRDSKELFEILTEPFEYKGRTYIGYGRGHYADTCFLSVFEGPEYGRVIEPPLKKGDKISRNGSTATVEAVSSIPDDDGDFIAIILREDGNPDFTYFGKRSEWTKVDA